MLNIYSPLQTKEELIVHLSDYIWLNLLGLVSPGRVMVSDRSFREKGIL
jgi:hypothetical protein